MKEETQRFNFTSQLMQSVKLITAKDIPLVQDEFSPVSQFLELSGNLRQIPSKICKLYESRDFLIFALANYENKLGSTLVVYYFSKARGENQFKQIPTIKGRVTSMQFIEPRLENKSIIKQEEQGLLIIVGNAEGYLKILDFGHKPQLTSFQIDTKPIVDIQVPSASNFSNHRVCFALAQDYSVFIVSIELEAVIAHFRPTIMMCDSGLSLSLHHSMKYFLEATKGGYIVLWKINENIFNNLKKFRKQKQVKKKMPNQIQIQNQEEEQPKKKNKKPPQKIYNVFPSCILHSASIQGLKFIQFMGDLIVMVTGDGKFKIIALNICEKEEFATVLEYQIENGETVNDAKILPKQECLIVSRREKNSLGCLIQCIFFSPELTVTHLFQVKLFGMSLVQSFLLNENHKFFFARNDDKFFINYTSVFSDKLQENEEQNKSYRSLNY